MRRLVAGIVDWVAALLTLLALFLLLAMASIVWDDYHPEPAEEQRLEEGGF